MYKFWLERRQSHFPPLITSNNNKSFNNNRNDNKLISSSPHSLDSSAPTEEMILPKFDGETTKFRLNLSELNRQDSEMILDEGRETEEEEDESSGDFLEESVNFPDAPSEEQVQRWISLGDVQQLEQLVLDGRAHLLKDKSSTNLASAEFLQGISQYQSKVDSIHKAVEEGDVRRVKSLIDRTMLATARDSHGMTPLHKALLYGQTITVRFLLTKYPHCVNEPDHAGRTALHFAAADSNGEHMIKVLQKAGGDAFIEDKYGHTPFYYRTHGKRLNIRTLKDNAVINQLISGQLNRPLLQDLEEDITDWIHTGNIGKLEELVLNGYADLLLGRNHLLDDVDAISFLEVLPQYQAKVQAIHKAIEQGNLRAVKLLTDRKKLAFCRDSRGLAPLHKSVVFGQTEIAKYLIRNYPQSVNSMDQSKRTPLHYSAALKDGGYMYKLMRKAGADPNTFDCNGRLPKYYLKYPGELNLERMRLDTKQALKQILHTRVAPSYLETNIQQWLREGNLAKLDQLVMSGCGDLVLDKKSNNPEAQIFLKELPSLLSNIDSIHREIREGGIETIKQLITNKRLALARDKHGCTPLHTAIIHEQTEIIRFLAANFPLVLNAPDYNKRTAMHYAAAARDGGHYLKILGKAGADPMAVDNEGRTPDYYRRNAVFDLKLLKERDVEELGADALLSKSVVSEDTKNNYNEEFVQQHGDFPDSPSESADLLSLHSSGVDTGRKGLEKVGRDGGEFIDDGELLEFDGNGEDGIDDGEDAEKNRFEHLLHERLGMPTSDNGLYLARTVAPVLTKALAEVLLRRPANPIGFISDWLVKYTEETEQF
uniref:ANK_REP_REGION domain-containing protein n=1 Tax=Meloidogyne hapla TaxID=6305 RepID=A0A1I8BXT1_MELHA